MSTTKKDGPSGSTSSAVTRGDKGTTTSDSGNKNRSSGVGKAQAKGRGSTIPPNAPYTPGVNRTTLRSVSEVPNSQTISQSVTFKVVKLGAESAVPPAVHKHRRTAALADNSGAVRSWIFGDKQISEGHYYKIRNFCQRDGRLVIHSRTSTVRIPPFDIPNVHIERAEQIYNTPFYPIKPINDIIKGPVKVRVSFRGRITQVDEIREIDGGKRVREVCVTEEGAVAHVSLWDNAASVPVRTGQMMTGHDVITVYSHFHKTVCLSVSYADEIMVSQSGSRSIHAKMDGLEQVSDDTFKVGLSHEGTDAEYVVSGEILRQGFSLPNIDVDCFIGQLPQEVVAYIDGLSLTSISPVISN